MTSKEHQKHAKLIRPAFGNFHRNELAFLGTPCGKLRPLLETIAESMADKIEIGFLEADHQSTLPEHPFFTAFTDKISFHRLDTQPHWNKFDYPLLFNHLDLLLINGNHFTGKHQVVIIDPAKSLSSKLEKLTDVKLIIKYSQDDQIPDYLQAHLGDQLKAIPQCTIDEHAQILSFLENFLITKTPVLKGLVLAGGESMRMGTDKGQLKYYQKNHREHLLDLQQLVGLTPHLSVRAGQIEQSTSGLALIEDSFTGLGSLGAILSAFRYDPDAAWLVVATDMPYVDQALLQMLIESRNPGKFATAFLNEETGFPEPLITIWEPRSYSRALQFLAQGYSCPRKILINSSTELLRLSDQSKLTNVNKPDEYEQVMKHLRTTS